MMWGNHRLVTTILEHLTFCVSAMFLTLPYSGWGQESKRTLDPVYLADTVRVERLPFLPAPLRSEVFLRIPIDPQLIPVSVSVVPQREMEEQGSTDLNDVLRNVSGINVRNSLGMEDDFIIRGLESSEAGLLYNGIKQQNRGLFDLFGYGFIDLYNAGQIEVLKGPSAFLYGGNAMSGVVNVQTMAGDGKHGSRTRLAYDQDRSIRVIADLENMLTAGNGTYEIRTLLKHVAHDLRHGRQDVFALNPVLSIRREERPEWDLFLEYTSAEIIPDIGIPLCFDTWRWVKPDVPSNTRYQSPFDQMRVNKLNLQATGGLRMGPDLEIRIQAYSQNAFSNSILTLIGSPYYDRWGSWWLDRSLVAIDERKGDHGLRFEHAFTPPEWTRCAFFNLGIDFDIAYHDAVIQESILEDVPLLDPVGPEQELDALQQIKPRHIKGGAATLAPYLMAKTDFSGNKQIYAGLRYDLIGQWANRRVEPFDYLRMFYSSQPGAFSTIEGQLSPMLGIVVEDSPQLSYYASAGSAFGDGNRIGESAQRSSQVETGYKYSTADGRVTNVGAFFILERDNISLPVSEPYQDSLYSFSGRQRVTGFEFEFRYYPNRYWNVRAAGTVMESRYLAYRAAAQTEYLELILKDFSRARAPYSPTMLFNAWCMINPSRHWQCGLGFNYTGKQYVSIANDFEIEAFSTWDLAVHYKTGVTRLSYHVHNLFGIESLTRGLGPNLVVPTDTFRMTLSLERHF